MIEIEKLSKRFGKFTAIDQIDLKIAAGDRIALIGLNGAGKTTLIRLVLGQYLHEGKLLVFGKSPRRHRVEILDRIGFVPQIPPPIQMSVGELVSFSASISYRSSRESIIEKSHELGFEIEANLKKPFLKLSGGMKQKLLIALALSREPDILIMDEPAANLDPQARQAFFLMLLRSMEQTTMLLSSHRVDEVINLINRIVEIDHGRIVQDELISESRMADQLLNCRVMFTEKNEKAMQMLQDWNFERRENGLSFEGSFIGTERLRFMTTISHFANQIKSLNIN